MNFKNTRRIRLARTIMIDLFAILVLTGCGASTVSQIEQKKNASQLEPEAVLSLVESNTLFFRSFNEETYYYFDLSGNLFGQDIYNNKDTGKWDVSDTGELCMKLQWWWYGDLRCYPVFADGEKYYLANSAGVITYTAELYPGDHKKQYHDVSKNKKKSIRRSIRQQEAATPLSDESAAPSPDVPPTQIIIEEGTAARATESELKSTVKWMAKDCPGCNLAQTNLKKADLVGAQLQGANLAGANLSMANLRRADLQGADLENADLSYANLPGADLRGCNLTNASFKGANLIRSDLTGADTTGADFSDALLEGVTGLEK